MRNVNLQEVSAVVIRLITISEILSKRKRQNMNYIDRNVSEERIRQNGRK
jgi:hypothetical protein